jgi:hypothetical protein
MISVTLLEAASVIMQKHEIELNRFRPRMPIPTVIAQGYLAGTRELPSDSEIDSLLTRV